MMYLWTDHPFLPEWINSQPFLFSALKQDFTAIDGHWETASKLSAILCQCCIGLELPEVPEYKVTFLPDVVDNVLTLLAKLHDLYCKSKKVKQYFSYTLLLKTMLFQFFFSNH